MIVLKVCMRFSRTSLSNCMGTKISKPYYDDDNDNNNDDNNNL